MRVIVDTNIIVSGLISPTGPPGKIVDALLQGFLVPVMSQATLAELEAVLMRRAGYEVRVMPVEDHSWEENPPTLVEFLRRVDAMKPAPEALDASSSSLWIWTIVLVIERNP